jgi:predicted TIM-barrel fold metal-dependent hydrolase
MPGVRAIPSRLAERWVMGCYLHTHSGDRRLDHFAFYALGSELDVPIATQAGTSGGLMASECGRPIGIDRPALDFPDTRVLLVPSGLAGGRRGDRHGAEDGRLSVSPLAGRAPELRTRSGRHKVLFGTNLPTVGHRHALAQLTALGLDSPIQHA